SPEVDPHLRQPPASLALWQPLPLPPPVQEAVPTTPIPPRSATSPVPSSPSLWHPPRPRLGGRYRSGRTIRRGRSGAAPSCAAPGGRNVRIGGRHRRTASSNRSHPKEPNGSVPRSNHPTRSDVADRAAAASPMVIEPPRQAASNSSSSSTPIRPSEAQYGSSSRSS